MKLSKLQFSASIVLVFGLLSTSRAQTLADMARAARKGKPAPAATPKVYTNESLEFQAAKVSAKSDSPANANSAGSADAVNKSADKDASADPAKEKQKLADEWKVKIDAQKAEIAQLQRELDVSQRENKLRAAAFYGDAGNRLRDEKKYADDDRKYQAEAAEKQKKIATVQQALEKLRDDARKAGVPPGSIP